MSPVQQRKTGEDSQVSSTMGGNLSSVSVSELIDVQRDQCLEPLSDDQEAKLHNQVHTDGWHALDSNDTAALINHLDSKLHSADRGPYVYSDVYGEMRPNGLSNQLIVLEQERGSLNGRVMRIRNPKDGIVLNVVLEEPNQCADGTLKIDVQIGVGTPQSGIARVETGVLSYLPGSDVPEFRSSDSNFSVSMELDEEILQQRPVFEVTIEDGVQVDPRHAHQYLIVAGELFKANPDLRPWMHGRRVHIVPDMEGVEAKYGLEDDTLAMTYMTGEGFVYSDNITFYAVDDLQYWARMIELDAHEAIHWGFGAQGEAHDNEDVDEFLTQTNVIAALMNVAAMWGKNPKISASQKNTLSRRILSLNKELNEKARPAAIQGIVNDLTSTLGLTPDELESVGAQLIATSQKQGN